jgi:hypothetical protein
MRWAALIKRVYGADPLRCPRCGGTMELISILTRRAQPAVVRKILEHCGLWTEPRARPPPHSANRVKGGRLHALPIV